MKFGTFNLHSVAPWSTAHEVARNQFDEMLAAERHGFDEIWLAEHNGRRYGMVGNTVTAAAAVAAATSRIRIATAVTRLPLHHPLHLAEDLAYVDHISGGRLDWGVGKGYDKLEFATYGVDFEEREERWQEVFDAVRHIWATGRTEFTGKFFLLGDGELLPPPYQRPGLPIYIMVSGSATSVLAAAKDLLPIASGSGPTWDELRTRLSLYGEAADRAGHPRDLIEAAVANAWQLKPMHVAKTTEQAIKEYRKGLVWYMNELGNRSMFGFAREPRPYEYFVQHKSVLLGSPEKLVDDLGAYCEASGVNNVICWFNMGGQPHEQVLEALQRFGEDVAPKLRGVVASPVVGVATADPEQ